MKANLGIDAERLQADLAALAVITEPGRPWTRRAFSPLYQQGRAWLSARMAEAGLTVRLDAAGNLWGRRAGSGGLPGAIVLGSHTDTVPEGGRFDGVLGVLAALEVARALQERGITLAHDLEVVDCLAEEVSPFGPSCLGSRAIAGLFPPDWLERRDAEGRVLRAALAEAGGDASALAGAARADASIAAYLELHIEQGPILEHEGLDLGLVTAIAGITRVEITVTGQADHAGTTPMGLRRDALVAGSAMVLKLREIAGALAAAGAGHFAATVGEMRVEPNAANVVPSQCRMLVDARAEQRGLMERFLAALAGLEALALAEGCGFGLRVLSDAAPVPSDEAVLEDLAAAAERLGARHRRMASGAGHDMAWFARVAPAAMLFVPSAGGRSHTPEEWTEPEACALGTAVLAEAVIGLDRRLAGDRIVEKG